MKRVISVVLTVALVATIFAGCSCGYSKKIDEEAGYEVDKYITLGKYKGFKYNIDQKKFDTLFADKTFESTTVNRAAKMGDEIEFSYTGFIKDKKVPDLSQENIAAETDQKDNATYKKMTDALIGKKKGDSVTIKLSGADASKISNTSQKYTDEVTFKLKVIEVSKVKHVKVTDEWVKNESNEDVDTVAQFYKAIRQELIDNAKSDLWQRAIDNAKMTTWPTDLYEKVKEESEQDANYNAAQWDMTLEEYYKMNGDTEDSLEKEYLNQVKSTLVMWAVCKEEHITVSDKDIEARYAEMLKDDLKDDDDYKTVDDVKKDYSKKEIKEAVYLQKAMDFVYDHSDVKITYKPHNN